MPWPMVGWLSVLENSNAFTPGVTRTTEDATLTRTLAYTLASELPPIGQHGLVALCRFEVL